MCSVALHAWVALSLLASAGAETVVVATESKPALFERMARVQDWNAVVDGHVLDVAEVQRRMTGLAQPRIPNTTEMSAALAQASDCQGSFDAQCAARLRNSVIDAYDNAVLPNRDLQTLAAAALHDLSSAELGESHREAALALARTALRRFPNMALDTRRHAPPVVQLYIRAAADLAKAPTSTVIFHSTRPGRLMVDGLEVVSINDVASRKLAHGVYRVWVSDDRSTSLVHELTVTSDTPPLDIDFALESVLSWKPAPTLACGASCDAQLAALAKATKVQQAVGLRLEDSRAPAMARVVTEGGEPRSVIVGAMANLDAPPELSVAQPVATAQPTRSQFSPWSLVPFGVGQFAQGRYVAGACYATIEAGLLAWHLVALSRANSYGGPSIAENDDRRAQRNISAAVLAGALIANVVEAIVVDAVSNE